MLEFLAGLDRRVGVGSGAVRATAGAGDLVALTVARLALGGLTVVATAVASVSVVARLPSARLPLGVPHGVRQTCRHGAEREGEKLGDAGAVHGRFLGSEPPKLGDFAAASSSGLGEVALAVRFAQHVVGNAVLFGSRRRDRCWRRAVRDALDHVDGQRVVVEGECAHAIAA